MKKAILVGLSSLVLFGASSAMAADWQCGTLTLSLANNGMATGVVLELNTKDGDAKQIVNPIAVNETVADFITANSDEKKVCVKGSAFAGAVTPAIQNLLIYSIKSN